MGTFLNNLELQEEEQNNLINLYAPHQEPPLYTPPHHQDTSTTQYTPLQQDSSLQEALITDGSASWKRIIVVDGGDSINNDARD